MPGYNLTRIEAEERARILAVQSYDITVDLTATGETFPVTTLIRFTCAEPGASTFLDLIAPSVDKVTLNGLDLDPAQVFADSRITLSDLKSENEVRVKANAEYSHTGEGLHRFVDPVDSLTYIYTQFEVADARRLFASFEQPDLKSRFTFHVIAPDDWTVIANTETPAPSPLPQNPGAARWDFPETPIMSTYLTAIIAGHYARWDDTYTSTDGRAIPLAVLARKSMAQYMDYAEVFDITKRGFEFYEKSFGIPYPYDKYDQAFVPEYNAGAMENIGAVTLTEARYVWRSRPLDSMVDARANTILHEQAHMWFGDLVTMKWWNDLWLNESFAEFMSHYAAVGNTRWTGAWADFLGRKMVGYAQDQLPTTHPIVAEINDLADVEVNFDMITYAKGASVLKQLVAWVGEENFLTGVHNYLTKHAWGNATLTDFLAELSASSGRDLTSWSKVWLEEAGVTTLRPVVVAQDEGVYSSVSVAQEIPAVYGRFTDIPHRGLPAIDVHPSLKPHRVGIAGYSMTDQGLEKAWGVEADVDGALTELPELTGQVIPDLLLLNDADLTYAKLRLAEYDMALVRKHLNDIVDPLARALIWASLWDALRDGELAARDYIEIVLNNIADETSSTTVSSTLARLAQTVRRYVAADMREEVRDDVAARLVKLALQADAGSDMQLQLFASFAHLACNDTQWDFLVEVLDGAAQVEGLVVDTDLRWELLTILVANSKKGEADIQAELTRDDTSSGREMAAGARAALPSTEAKREAWRLAVRDKSVANAAQRSIIAAFPGVPDPTSLREFAVEYFASLEWVWENRTREMANNIVKALYPFWAINDEGIDVLAMTDQWLNHIGARTPALRRLVLANREEVVCARIARAKDSE
ncbi:MAG: aminopeptidase N [Propionibacteriaceae bacterium]|nr:aminopeptidase N [Propionibacteriaceae bacterium]